MMRRLLLGLCLIVPMPASAQLGCDMPIELNDGWTRATPAQVGIDTNRLCRIDRFLEQWPEHNIHAVLVVRRGKLVMDRYFTGTDERWGTPLGKVVHTAEQMHDLRSITKSVVSLLVGIAIGEGKFPPLDSSAIDFFPELSPLRTTANARITFRHLLDMSSGIAWNESIPYSDRANSESQMNAALAPIRYVFSQPVVKPPGTAYNYNGGNTVILGTAVAKVLGGGELPAYARAKLFERLDFGLSDWVYVSEGREPAFASGLRLRPRDTAKLGQIMLTDGVWNGRQVLPKGWAAESIKPRINGSGVYFYGYQWWLGRSLHHGREHTWFAGFGEGGQRLFVVPSLELVVMINAGHYGDPLQNTIPAAIFNDLVMAAVAN
jgi:CubicO group peptidase (beta-lactamase class C family)